MQASIGGRQRDTGALVIEATNQKTKYKMQYDEKWDNKKCNNNCQHIHPATTEYSYCSYHSQGCKFMCLTGYINVSCFEKGQMIT